MGFVAFISFSSSFELEPAKRGLQLEGLFLFLNGRSEVYPPYFFLAKRGGSLLSLKLYHDALCRENV
jgi:hypothetical protein